LGEIATRELAKEKRPYGLEQNKRIVKEGGEIANNTRKDLEIKFGKTIISNQNSLNYKYLDENKKIENP